MYRQGDVLIVPVTQIPAGAETQEQGRVILAHGEATGHHHAIESPEARLMVDGEERFLALGIAAQLTHQEHGAIDLPAGNYRIIRQREYQPDAVRFVAD